VGDRPLLNAPITGVSYDCAGPNVGVRDDDGEL